jgi:hypothetical protein
MSLIFDLAVRLASLGPVKSMLLSCLAARFRAR